MSDAFASGIHWKTKNRHLDLETLGEHHDVTFAKWGEIFDNDVTIGKLHLFNCLEITI